MTLSSLHSIKVRDKSNSKNPEAGNTSKAKSNNSVSPGKLAEFKKVALRRGTWFRALSQIERGVIDLTVKYVDNIRSEKLANVVTAIIAKLQLAMESTADRLVRTIGLPLARKNSNIAVSWGNSSASKWAEDLAFAKYLALSFGKS